ncbi:MAG TPA: YggT family protein [Rhizomicrobium sp.]
MSYPFIHAFKEVFDAVLGTYFWIVVAAVILGWLLNFGAIRLNNELARAVAGAIYGLTEPVFRRVRKVIPAIAGIDFSPFIVGIALEVIQSFGDDYLYDLMAWSLRQAS